MNHTADTLDELAAFGSAGEPAADLAAASASALTDMVERNPIPSVLAAAAAGAGLMALVSLMARRDPDPLAPVPLVSPRAFDYEALKQQIATLTDRLSDRFADRVGSAAKAAPVDAAKQRVSQAGEAIADGWSTVRSQAIDALGRFEPQATAAIKVARENPVWTALIVGAVGALVGSQMLGAKPSSPTQPQSGPERRRVRLQIACEMVLQAAADCPTVAMLRPCSGDAQWLVSERYDFEPSVRITEYVDAYGNLCQRFVIPQGQMTIRIAALVETEDEILVDPNAPATPVADLPNDTLQYLLQSRYCPSDKAEAESQALAIVGHLPPGYAQVEAIRAWINANIAYRYGVSNSATDALDTLSVGAGVCRDFSHIGITLCRALRIPARMVVGYLYRLDPMDLHAWFEAFIDGRWYTFDATQSQARGGRVVVAYGHDAADVAFLSNYASLETSSLNVTVDLAPPN